MDVHVRQKEQAAIRFQRALYLAAVLENSTKVSTVAVVNVLGTSLNENIRYVIQNRSPQFTIGRTSGVVSTVGHVFDRELQDSYQLAIQVNMGLKRSFRKLSTFESTAQSESPPEPPPRHRQPPHPFFSKRSGWLLLCFLTTIMCDNVITVHERIK